MDDFEEESAKEDATPESDTCQPANRDSETDNCKSKSGRVNVLKLGRRFNSLIANISSGFGRSAGQKLPKKKVTVNGRQCHRLTVKAVLIH